MNIAAENNQMMKTTDETKQNINLWKPKETRMICGDYGNEVNLLIF